jgi:hypothetical protein
MEIRPILFGGLVGCSQLLAESANSDGKAEGLTHGPTADVVISSVASIFEEVEWLGGWDLAKVDAESRGGRLAILDTASKQNKVERLGLSGFIGAKDENRSGKWQWINGEPVIGDNWAPGQPDRADQEFLFVRKDGKWDDRTMREGDRYILERLILIGEIGDRFSELTERWEVQLDRVMAPLVDFEAKYLALLNF